MPGPGPGPGPGPHQLGELLILHTYKPRETGKNSNAWGLPPFIG